MWSTEKIGACIKECITADRELEKKETNREKVKRQKVWERREGGLTKEIASVCSGIVFGVLIFRSLLRKKKCSIQLRISNYTPVCCTWEGRNMTTQSDFQAPKKQQLLPDIRPELLICALEVHLHFVLFLFFKHIFYWDSHIDLNIDTLTNDMNTLSP